MDASRWNSISGSRDIETIRLFVALEGTENRDRESTVNAIVDCWLTIKGRRRIFVMCMKRVDGRCSRV